MSALLCPRAKLESKIKNQKNLALQKHKARPYLERVARNLTFITLDRIIALGKGFPFVAHATLGAFHATLSS